MKIGTDKEILCLMESVFTAIQLPKNIKRLKELKKEKALRKIWETIS
jgi:hypothetical protein